MFAFLKKLFSHRPRIVRVVTYAEADKLMREKPGEWKIAREEDNNTATGLVFIEKVQE